MFTVPETQNQTCLWFIKTYIRNIWLWYPNKYPYRFSKPQHRATHLYSTPVHSPIHVFRSPNTYSNMCVNFPNHISTHVFPPTPIHTCTLLVHTHIQTRPLNPKHDYQQVLFAYEHTSKHKLWISKRISKPVLVSPTTHKKHVFSYIEHVPKPWALIHRTYIIYPNTFSEYRPHKSKSLFDETPNTYPNMYLYFLPTSIYGCWVPRTVQTCIVDTNNNTCIRSNT